MTPFLKMHGCGNDFVVINAKAPGAEALLADNQAISKVCDRYYGIGCDQLIVIAPSAAATAEMRIFNADGSVAGMCGNAARCVADILLKESGADRVTIAVGARILEAWREKDVVTVDMGLPRTAWADIPLGHAADTAVLDLGLGLPPAFCVSMGNPHAVFFVEDADSIDLERLGPMLENHPIFPARANIEFAHLEKQGQLRARVWERGAGVTLACGSGACAVGYAAFMRGVIVGAQANIRMDGGILDISLRKGDGHIVMGGPIAYVYSGALV